MIFKQTLHFDKSRVDEDGEYVKCMGFCDWTQDIINAYKIGVKGLLITNRNMDMPNEKSEGHKEEDAENSDGKPEAIMFSK